MAANEAVFDSRVDLSSIPSERKGLFLGSGDLTKVGNEDLIPATREGSSGTFRDIDYRTLNVSCLNKVPPFYLLESLHNNLFSFLSAHFDIRGANASLASLSPCGAQALELAVRSVRLGRADTIIVVGCGSWISPLPLFELNTLGLLSACRQGASSFRPFDRKRDGFIPGEGGAAMVLEPVSRAKDRGARIYGVFKGTGSRIGFEHSGGLGTPEKIAEHCVRRALEAADLRMDKLGFVLPHGNATRRGDASEMASLLYLTGKDSSFLPPLCGLKPYTGHMGAASDIGEIIIGILTAGEDFVPGTLSFQGTDPGFSCLAIGSSPQRTRGNVFLSVSCGMGGQSSALVVEAQTGA
jgi:3-oxoacyl-[acyl-carrier-protein] synthase II